MLGAATFTTKASCPPAKENSVVGMLVPRFDMPTTYALEFPVFSLATAIPRPAPPRKLEYTRPVPDGVRAVTKPMKPAVWTGWKASCIGKSDYELIPVT